MNWPSMTSLTCFDTMRSIHTCDISREYASLSRYERGMQLVDGTVYFASLADYAADSPGDFRVAFILYDQDPKARVEVTNNQNVGKFDNRDAFETCFAELAEEFKAVRGIETGIFNLVQMVAKNEGIDRIIEAVYEMFGHPISLIDNSFNYVAVSDGFNELNRKFGSDIASGRIDPVIQTDLSRTEIFHPMGIRRHPLNFKTILADEDGTPLYNTITLVYINTMIVGSFSLFTAGSPLPRTRTNYLPSIAAVLSMEFQKNDYWLENKGSFYTHLFNELLFGDFAPNSSSEDIKLRFKVGGYTLMKYKCIVFFDMSGESYTMKELQTISGLIKESMPNCIFFINDGNIIFLVSSEEYFDIDDIEAGTLSQITKAGLDNTRVRVGFSSLFTDIHDIRDCYRQSKSAIEIGQKMGRRNAPTFTYDRYRSYNLLSHLESQDDFSMYLYPPLMAVIREDGLKGTHLAFTLYTFLLDPEHPAAVCEALGIHKNTLYFRLNKAKEIMHHDYRNGWVVSEIMVTFRLLEYQGEFKRLVLQTDKE